MAQLQAVQIVQTTTYVETAMEVMTKRILTNRINNKTSLHPNNWPTLTKLTIS